MQFMISIPEMLVVQFNGAMREINMGTQCKFISVYLC